MERLGEAIRRIRMARGIEQEELAQRSGFTQSYISKVENCIINPSLKALKKISAGLGIEEKDIFTSKEQINLDDETLYYKHLDKSIRQMISREDSIPYLEFAKDLYNDGFTDEELNAIKIILLSRKKR